MAMLKASSIFTIGYIITGVGSDVTQYTLLQQIVSTSLVLVAVYVWWATRK